MEAGAFLSTQRHWLEPCGADVAGAGAGGEQEPAAKRRCAARAASVVFACRASLHVCLAEQAGGAAKPPLAWSGAWASQAVFIRLVLPGGVVSSTMDARASLQDGGEGEGEGWHLVLELFGAAYRLCPQHLLKVVCAPSVFATALAPGEQQQQQGHHGASCLLAEARPTADRQRRQGVEFVTLVTPHVCLNLFTQQCSSEAVQGLAGIARALHDQAPCCGGRQALAACSSAGGAAAVVGGGRPWSPPDDPAKLAELLSGFECEAKLLQLVVGGGGSLSRSGFGGGGCTAWEPEQQRHLLQALAHLHAGL